MKGIRYISDGMTSGYGRAARGYLRALVEAGVPVTWTPMMPSPDWGMFLAPCHSRSIGDSQFDWLCNRPLEYDKVVVHTPPHYYRRWRRDEPNKTLAGLTVWETDRLPDSWPPMLADADRVLVPSRWNRDVFVRGGVREPISVVPHVPEPIDGDVSRDEPRSPKGPFVFYTIGAWSERKAVYKLLQCYWNTFRRDDPVLLIIKTGRTDERRIRYGRVSRWAGSRLWSVLRTVRQIGRGYASPAPIRVLPRHLSAPALQALHARGDCYVSLTRGEAWGLGAYEAAAAGKPVIMTGFGGQLDYLPKDLAYLVDYRLVPVEPTGIIEREIFGSGQRWAEPDLAHASARMREVLSEPREARRRGEALRRYVHEIFAPATIAARLVAALA